ncbi:MAG: P1 family peptidase [Cyanobacteria bacterium]|nr:P1 family peptidase [Cyanobacteriota bacterium]
MNSFLQPILGSMLLFSGFWVSCFAQVNTEATMPEGFQLPAYFQQLPSGKNHTITDVPGVRVGHVTYLKTEALPPIATGVTAVLPTSTDALSNTGFWAAVYSLNGNGELTGTHFIQQSGLLNGPILLTNTRAVGVVFEGVHQYFEQHGKEGWASELPVVGECWDGFFNGNPRVVRPEDVSTAILNASTDPVAQGRVGAGCGMRSFELHAGIGSASRQVARAEKYYTVGVLVNTNHSVLSRLNPALKTSLEAYLSKSQHRPLSLQQLSEEDNRDVVPALKVFLKKLNENKQNEKKLNPKPDQNSGPDAPGRQGSIMVIIATDAPLLPHQLQALARHAGLGIGLAGGLAATHSGDLILAFSTANAILMKGWGVEDASTLAMPVLVSEGVMNQLYAATIEAVVDAQMQAIIAAHAK